MNVAQKLHSFLQRLDNEINLIGRGVTCIIGIDEVGRGPLAGPMVVCGATFTKQFILSTHEKLNAYTERGDNRNNDVLSEGLNWLLEINDSKKVSKKNRETIDRRLRNESSFEFALEEIPVSLIDSIGIAQATQMGFFNVYKKLATNLSNLSSHALTDSFPIKALPVDKQSNIVKGDSKSLSIAAASIIAKVYRDNVMKELHNKHPIYNFYKNVGYGTKEHLEALKEHGFCEAHRKSFEPIKSMANGLTD